MRFFKKLFGGEPGRTRVNQAYRRANAAAIIAKTMRRVYGGKPSHIKYFVSNSTALIVFNTFYIDDVEFIELLPRRLSNTYIDSIVLVAEASLLGADKMIQLGFRQNPDGSWTKTISI